MFPLCNEQGAVPVKQIAGIDVATRFLGMEANLLPPTTQRVQRNTSGDLNRRIASDIRDSIAYYSKHIEEIDDRLAELDAEWDTERTLEANAASLAFIGIALGATVDRRWLALPAAVTAFLFQHATQGWCPPLPVLRRLGFRTAKEISQEKYALKALRGDFDGVSGQEGGGKVRPALRAVELPGAA